MKRVAQLFVLTLTLLAVSVAPSAAASIVFSGVDVGGGIGGPRVNSDASHAAWLAAVGVISATESFEGFAIGSSAPLLLAGGMTLTTVGAPVAGTLNQVTNDQDDQTGYNTTAGGANFFRFTSEFSGVATLTFTFGTPVDAFGVYVTGVQPDFGATTATWGAESFVLPDTQGAPGFGGVQFFGFLSDTPITSISFTMRANPSVGRDVMGFDDIQISPAAVVPEPGTVVLLLSGLVAVAVSRRRR